MSRSGVIAVSLAAIVCCHFHCVVHRAKGARLLGAALTAAELGEAMPLSGETPRTENESGCICRGAVLISAVQAPTLDRGPWNWVSWQTIHDLQPIAWSELQLASPATAAAAVHPPDLAARFFGRLLRAWIASLVI